MPDLGYSTALADRVIEEVQRRYRFDQADNLLTNPNVDEMRASVLDALAELNSQPPVTNYTLEQVLQDQFDPRYRTLLYLGAAKNILTMLLADWTANGFSLAVQEFNVEDRLSRYSDLRQTLSDDFYTRLEKFKIGTQVFARGISSKESPNVLAPFRSRVRPAERW